MPRLTVQWATLIGLALFTLPVAVVAQDEPSLPPDVDEVISGGWWERAPDSVAGEFRVVIRTSGFEHRISSLQVDWIAQPEDADQEAKVVASVRVPEVEGGWVLLHDPQLEDGGNGWVLVVDATNTHCDPMPTDRWRIALGAPGSIKVLGSYLIRPGCVVD